MSTRTFKIQIPSVEWQIYYVQAIDEEQAWEVYEKLLEDGDEPHKYEAGECLMDDTITDVTHENL